MEEKGVRIDSRQGELARLRARVAELEAAEIHRKETEEQFRAFVETTNEWIWAIDLQERHTYSNPALETILGYSPGEFMAGSSLIHLHEDDRRKVGGMLKEKIARKEGWAGLVLRWRHRDGRYRYLESTAVPILDERGEVRGFQGADRDISERRRAEEALRESEARFRSLVETTSDWIWEVDARAAYTYCSPKVFDLLGYEPGEIIGKRPFDLMPPAETRRLAPLISEMMAEARPFNGIENINLHKDGRLVRLETSGVPILDGQGLLTGYRGIDRDITQRKETERVLREEFAFRNAIIECAADGLCVCHEISEFPHVGFTVWNNRMTEITGFSMEEINRLGWYQSLYPDPEVQARARERMARMRAGDNLKGEEWEISRSDGTMRTVQIRKVLL